MPLDWLEQPTAARGSYTAFNSSVAALTPAWPISHLYGEEAAPAHLSLEGSECPLKKNCRFAVAALMHSKGGRFLLGSALAAFRAVRQAELSE